MENVVEILNDMDPTIINLELQTTGVMLDDENLEFLRDNIGIETISLSLVSFDELRNSMYCEIPIEHHFVIKELCQKIKDYGFNLRLSLNMTDSFELVNTPLTVESIFKKAKDLGADQITFRKLYSTGNNKIADWINAHKCSDTTIEIIEKYIKDNGVKLERLSFVSRKYSIDEISTVIDDNCMANFDPEVENAIKYFIIREDGRLYTRWDNRGSKIF